MKWEPSPPFSMMPPLAAMPPGLVWRLIMLIFSHNDPVLFVQYFEHFAHLALFLAGQDYHPVVFFNVIFLVLHDFSLIHCL